LKTEIPLRIIMTDSPRFGFFSGEVKRGLKVDDEKHVKQSSGLRKPIPVEEGGESQIRQNFHVKVEAGLNKQINLELRACYNFRSMGIFFDSDDVALPGFSKFFINKAEHEKKHAMKLMKLVNQRGGTVVLDDIEKPASENWVNGLGAMQAALEMVLSQNETLLELHKLTTHYADPHMDLIIKKYLCDHVEIIKKLGGHVTNLKRVGPKLGEYIFGQKTLNAEDIESDVSSDCDD